MKPRFSFSFEKRGFCFSKLHLSLISLNKGFFLKSPRPPLTLMRDFSKTHQSSLTRKGGSTSHLGLLPSGKKRKPPYSVLKPLRYKVGGPSEVFASSRAAFCGMRPHGYKSLTGCKKAMKPNTASSMIEITQHALKGQKLLAQGNALGLWALAWCPVRAKALKTPNKK